MLELVHVSKTYEMKGNTVHALDDVSIRFLEKGMVFLLGKSGSGKSTLLNVCGGLDQVDEGEIIVKGRSSRDFTKVDFDNYRNTFVGFVFQEYNVLSEYTVEENVSLALELQGKVDKKEVSDIIETVGLSSMKKRKPNTLSGGQRQRVAIARALVKHPEIIMADEPTGALDSETGKQVFDLLKKLSKEKLVVVVSHDGDYAKQYADRIIELKDGKVISDTSKIEVERKEERLTLVEDGYLAQGELTKEELAKIDEFLLSQGEITITADPKELGVVRDGLKRENNRFVPSLPVERKEYRIEESNFIESRLPLKHALKMGVSYLTIKPLKLLFSVLLSTIAFLVFGIFSTMVFMDDTRIIANAMSESKFCGIAMTHEMAAYMEVKGKMEDLYVQAKITNEDIEKLNAKDDSFKFGGVYNYRRTGFSVSMNMGTENGGVGQFYYSTQFAGFSEFSKEDLEESGMKLVAGTYPKTSEEIALPHYFYDAFALHGYRENAKEETQSIVSYDGLIGKVLTVNGLVFKVVGIVDTGELSKEYQSLMNVKSMVYGINPNYFRDSKLYNQFTDYLANSYHKVCFVAKGTYWKLVENEQFGSTVAKADITGEIPLIRTRVKVQTPWGTEYQEQNVPAYVTKFEVPNAERAKAQNEPLYDYVLTSLSENGTRQMNQASFLHGVRENHSAYFLQNDVVEAILETTEVIHGMEYVFLGAGIVTGIFSALLLYNFISSSIKEKEKEIGILRAIGARSIDLFKVFFVETFVVTTGCFLLGMIGTPFLCSIVNGYIMKNSSIVFSALLFGWKGALFLFGISLVIALVATFFPVRNASKKNPVEAIRAL